MGSKCLNPPARKTFLSSPCGHDHPGHGGRRRGPKCRRRRRRRRLGREPCGRHGEYLATTSPYSSRIRSSYNMLTCITIKFSLAGPVTLKRLNPNP